MSRTEALTRFCVAAPTLLALRGAKIGVEYLGGETRSDPFPLCHVCTHELQLPVCHDTYEAFKEAMDEAVSSGHSGYGLP